MTLSSVRLSSSSDLLATSAKFIDILLLFRIFNTLLMLYVTRIGFTLTVESRDYRKPQSGSFHLRFLAITATVDESSEESRSFEKSE